MAETSVDRDKAVHELQVDELKREQAKKDQSVITLENQLTHVQSELSCNKRQIEDLESLLKTVNSEYNEAKISLKEANNLKLKNENQIAALEKALKSLETEKEERRVEMEKCSNDYYSQRSEMASLRSEIQKKDDNIESLRNQLNTAKQAMIDFEKKADEKEKDKRNLNTEIEKNNSKIKHLEDKLNQEKVEIENKITSLKKLQENYDNLNKKYTDICKLSDERGKELTAIRDTISANERQYNNLTSRLNATESENNKLNSLNRYV